MAPEKEEPSAKTNGTFSSCKGKNVRYEQNILSAEAHTLQNQNKGLYQVNSM